MRADRSVFFLSPAAPETLLYVIMQSVTRRGAVKAATMPQAAAAASHETQRVKLTLTRFAFFRLSTQWLTMRHAILRATRTIGRARPLENRSQPTVQKWLASQTSRRRVGFHSCIFER